MHATRFLEAARRPAPKGPAHSFCLLCAQSQREFIQADWNIVALTLCRGARAVLC